MANRSKRVCSKGHDKDITGRTSDGKCLICRKEYLAKPRISKKQFCIHVHDTFVTGRTFNGSCKECKRLDYVPHPKLKNPICSRGHNKDIVGRDKYGDCKICTRADSEIIRLRYRNIIQTAKDKPCIDCNIKYPYYVMDFDHLGDKVFTIGSAEAIGCSIEKLLEEIAKCEVVCSNCHRTRTHNRKLAAEAN